MSKPSDDLSELINSKIEALRPRLLDLSRRNPLVTTRLSGRTNSYIRVVDGLPDILFFKLVNGQEMRFIPLPGLDDDPRDEQTEAFRDALANARLTDRDYLNNAEQLDSDSDDYLDLSRKLERTLKDKVREQLGLAPRPTKVEVNFAQHARNNGVSPSYELPKASNAENSEQFLDVNIQTLFLPKDLERKLLALNSKCNTWMQETGINVLQAAFGFLEWAELNSSETSIAPLILLQVRFEKRKTKEGLEFWVTGLGDEPEINTALSEKLRLEFGVRLPVFNGGSIEAYLEEVAAVSPKTVSWRARRQIAFGVFPSARMAMYHDLNTQKAQFDANEIIRRLFGGGEPTTASPFADEYRVDEPEIERKVPHLVLDADSSQFSTLVDIANGCNLAVEGPPGTGKSQTIINAIAAALADGKKVLFVAEKSAALNVVRSRLEAIGLGEFLLPLQAERSTREQVIQSIRDRLEMEAVSPPQHYEEELSQFRVVRNETALYIRTLTEQFEDCGLTVHEALGKSIATGERLAELPKEFQLGQFPVQKGLSVDLIKEVTRTGTLIEAAWEKAACAPSFWKGIKVSALSRFDIDEIFEQAEQLAGCLERLDQKFHELKQLGLDGFTLPGEAQDLAQVLEFTLALKNPVHVAIASRAAAWGTTKPLRDFLEKCQKLKANESSLKRIFQEEISGATLDALSELQTLCDEHRIESVDTGSLAKSLASKRQAIAMARKLAEQMRPFADLVPGSEHWQFGDIRKLRELTLRVGSEVIYFRKQAVSEAAGLMVLKKLNEAGRRLHAERGSLEEYFSYIEDISLEQMLECCSIFKEAGFFCFVNPEYWRAVKVYTRHAKKEYNHQDALALLERLIAWKRREADFSRDPQAALLYGLHFRGLDTDFGFFERLADFYDAVRETFAALDQKSIREFLISGDAEIVMQVPALETYPEGFRLKTLEDGIGQWEAEAASRELACKRIDDLATIFVPTAEIGAASLASLSSTIIETLSDRSSLNSNSHVIELLGGEFKGSETDAGVLEAVATLADAIAGLGPRAERVASVITAGNAGEVRTLVGDLIDAFTLARSLEAWLGDKVGLDGGSPLLTGPYAERAKALHAAALDRNGLDAHVEFARTKQEMDAALHGLVDGYFSAKGNYRGLGEALEALAFRSLARRAFQKHGDVLSKFPGTRLNELRKRVATLDRHLIKASRQALKAKMKSNAQPPRGCGTGKKSLWTELALIQHETSKKQRHISVRDLTRRAGRALLELKPCWMMSPLAVAQYLPKGQLSFDLCIIDEASQMTPEDAVGALARSRQTMIVGDTNQLPPSNFFRKMIDEEEADEDVTVLNESILEMANATFRPARRLRWHYRSRHSGLIQFSNRLVYDDNLVVFPSAAESAPGMGVEFRVVPGLYKSGTNAIEARAIVEAALHFMKENPDRSLGIVTLNQKQRELIFEEMEYALSRDPVAARYVEDWAARNDGLEQFFIKNLENVQGDERDVIFIGTVYGPEQPGARVMQRFGPINGVAGKRRLNVLFSRAKQLVVTFSSMNAGDITAEADGNEGAYLLKRWLEYSATGLLESGEPALSEPDSDFEIYVMDQIRAMGFTPVPQIGVRGYSIDIGVKHPHWPHGFILGVECDGASFHSSKSARDRDRLRQEVLEGLGWRFHRIWSTDWFNNPSKQADILRHVIVERLAELKAEHRAQAMSLTAANDQVVMDVASPKACTSVEKLAKPLVTEETDGQRVAIGDTVRVRYLTDDKRVMQFMISSDQSDPSNGVIYYKKPIAQALLGAEEGEEVEILVGSYLRPAILEKIVHRVN